jgi:hypothetical protein
VSHLTKNLVRNVTRGVLRPRLHRWFTMLTRKTPAARIACTAAFLALALALVPAAFAGKGNPGGGGGGGKTHGTTAATGSFSLVLLNSTDGLPHWGQQITFNVSVQNASYYFVALNCSQAGTLVYANTVGFYTGWAWSRTFYLQSSAWTGGAATCSAELYSSYSDGSNHKTLATMSFDVSA